MPTDTVTGPTRAAVQTTHVMSCGATVVVTGDDAGRNAAMANLAVDRLAELERRWSRFLATSEITALNDAAGRPCVVSTDTVELVVALVEGWHLTGGDFDPTLLGALVGLGYGSSRDDVARRTSLAPSVAVRGRPDGVLVDRAQGVVVMPFGTTLDPGGLGKGLAADLVVRELLQAGADGALVEVGGDLRVAGRPTRDTPSAAWTIAVDTAGADDRPVLIGLADGGVATSTSRLRTWDADGRRRHHLLDPATMAPSEHDTLSCTVIAGSAATAEVFTKVAFARPATDALARYEHHGLAASITTTHGIRLTTSAWQAFTIEGAPR